MDGSILAGNIAMSKNPKDFKIVGEVLNTEPIAIMLPKEDAEFKKFVDASIIKMMRDGTIAKMYQQWFLDPIPPKNVRVGLELSQNTKDAWANPNDKPAEEYSKK